MENPFKKNGKPFYVLILLVGLLFTAQYETLAQADTWATFPTKLSFTPTGTTVGNLSLSYNRVNNTIYDANGDLLFYLDGPVIKDAQGVSYDSLGSSNISSLNPEIGICEVPGNCNEFYVVRWERTLLGVNLIHARVNLNTSPMTVTTFAPLSQSAQHTGVLAIDQPQNKKNFDSDRWLYALSDDGTLDRYNITPSGISFDVNIFDISILTALDPSIKQLSFVSPEGEIKGNCFAWGSNLENKAYVVIFDQANGQMGQLITLPLPEGTTVCGIEFNEDVSKIYVAACGDNDEARGIYEFDFDNLENVVKLPVAEEGEEYYNTQLELGLDNFLYMVSDQGKLGRANVDVSNPTPSPIAPLGVTSGASFLSGFFLNIPFYTLPDQNDDDTNPGSPYASVTTYNINQQDIFPVSPPTPPSFYGCEPLQLYVSPADAFLYNFVIEKVATGDILVTTQFSPISTLPPAFVDLKDLPGVANIGATDTLAIDTTINGTISVTMNVQNACGTITAQKGLFELIPSPSQAVAYVGIEPGSGDSICNSKNFADPCTVGKWSGHLSFDNVAGVIDYYRIDAIRKIDCSTGADLGVIYSESNTSGVPPSSIGLNSLVIGDTTGYFADSITIGDCFRVDVTVGNVCGETTDFSYFQVNGAYKMGGGSQPSTVTDVGETLQVPPIRFAQISQEETVQWEYRQAQSGRVHITVRDMSGRIVLTHQDLVGTTGTHLARLNTTVLPEGVFLYQIETPTQREYGRFIVSR